ncbi:hypothetical protein [Paenibacillus sp. SN-8-1]|uniref:hypothetical protein n=1 Tax=Paenibacillus sp. SN-8-1 TaxID=3435409 RepID=UPI003D9A4F3C
MRKTEKAIFVDFTELKQLLGIKKIIVDAYLDKNSNQLVIEIDQEVRPAEGDILYNGRPMQVGEFHKQYQIDNRIKNGKVVRQELFE